MMARFTIMGNPCGKGRPRFSTNNGYVTARTPQKTVEYENLVRMEYKAAMGDKHFEKEVPLNVVIKAYYMIPKSVSKKKAQEMLDGRIRPTKKPDYDNIGKIVCDALNGIAYYDDSQIVDAHVIKEYAQIPRVDVMIWEAK